MTMEIVRKVWERSTFSRHKNIQHACLYSNGDLYLKGMNKEYFASNHLALQEPIEQFVDTGKVGVTGENKVLDFFYEAGIPAENILRPAHIVSEKGQIEVTDGIVIIDKTAFILQIKAKVTFIPEQSPGKLRAKMRKSVAQAEQQNNNSLKNIQRLESIIFKSFSGEMKSIQYSDYTWVKLNVLVYNKLHLSDYERYFHKEQENTFTITLNDLQEISKNGLEYMVNYLRRRQYSRITYIGFEILEYFKYLDKDLYPTESKTSLLLTIDKAFRVMLNNDGRSKKYVEMITRGIDMHNVNSLEQLQHKFATKIADKNIEPMTFATENFRFIIFFQNHDSATNRDKEANSIQQFNTQKENTIYITYNIQTGNVLSCKQM